MEGVKIGVLPGATRLPLVIEPSRAVPLHEWVRSHRAALCDELTAHGAVLFRGFAVRQVADFEAFVEAVSDRRMPYTYRSTPRTSVGNGIFTATEYPPAHTIPLHSENAYQRSWPLRVAFCCLQPASTGGETPLADLQQVTAAIDARVLDAFRSRGVTYIRHYRAHVDLPWQTVFQARTPLDVAKFCAENDIEHSWLDAETLRTRSSAQGVARHPDNGQEVIFNQAHLFHASSLGAQMEAQLIALFGRDRLPRHACFSDGGEIPNEDLESVRRAFSAAEQSFAWQGGDVLWLDNMQVAHGRRPFTGPRKVLAALLDPFNPTAAT